MSRFHVHFKLYECTAPIKLVLVVFWAEYSTTESRSKLLFILRFCLGLHHRRVVFAAICKVTVRQNGGRLLAGGGGWQKRILCLERPD